MNRAIPVTNRGSREIEVAIEPEGQTFQLAPGHSLEIRYTLEVGDPGFAVEIDDTFLSIHAMVDKAVFHSDGRRLR